MTLMAFKDSSILNLFLWMKALIHPSFAWYFGSLSRRLAKWEYRSSTSLKNSSSCFMIWPEASDERMVTVL